MLSVALDTYMKTGFGYKMLYLYSPDTFYDQVVEYAPYTPNFSAEELRVMEKAFKDKHQRKF